MSEQKIETEKSRYPERDGVPWFSESFFSNHAVMGKARRLYFIILAMTSFLIIFVILGKFLSLLQPLPSALSCRTMSELLMCS